MTKTFTALAAAATIALASVAAPPKAEARNGGAIAAGIIGGLAVGAIIGSAAAHNGGYGYYGYAPARYYAPHCFWTRQRVWDGYGWYVRPVRVCR